MRKTAIGWKVFLEILEDYQVWSKRNSQKSFRLSDNNLNLASVTVVIDEKIIYSVFICQQLKRL